MSGSRASFQQCLTVLKGAGLKETGEDVPPKRFQVLPGLGFRAWSLGFRAQGSGCRVEGKP